MNAVDQNKDLVSRYMNALWSGQNGEQDFCVPDVAIHTPSSPSGVGDMAQIAAYFRVALPDLKLHSTAVFGEEDRVMQHYTVTGKHTGAPLFNFPASGRELTLAGANIFRVAGGKIVERWSIIDAADLFQQLGANSK